MTSSEVKLSDAVNVRCSKRQHQVSPEVRKLQFVQRRSRKTKFTSIAVTKGTPVNAGLVVKRSRLSTRRTSSSSSSDSEKSTVGKLREPVHLKYGIGDLHTTVGFENSFVGDCAVKNGYCSTPVGKNSDLQGRLNYLTRSVRVQQGETTRSERVISSIIESPISTVIKDTSFHKDDGELAALNLSEIIASSCPNSTKKSCYSSSEPSPVTAETSTREASLFYGLPVVVKELLQKYRGIEALYDWQNDCLNLTAVLERKNLVYSLPTSGGKTLVAEILIFKELLVQEKDVLFILPFVSIVQEKVKSLTQFAVELGFLVEEYAASKGKIPPRKRRKKNSVYVATIEKANALVNSLIGENRLSTLGLVVVDELHMLGEVGRGSTLEMCLAKLLFVTPSTQLIGMSATLSNITDLKKFLKAEVYCSDFRPVELKEFVKVNSDIFAVPKSSELGEESFQPIRHITYRKVQDKQLLMRDPDHLVALVLEVIPQHSCLVFCPTKKNCQTLAVMLAQFMPREMCDVKAPERVELMKALYNEASGLCPVLKQVIPYGIAYHHSGLTMDERKLIEDAYSEGVLSLLTCTSTLAAGVNLPAKRVIVRAPYVANTLLTQSQYKQMVGRAGRAGIDTSGESILILKEKDKSKVAHLFSGRLESCSSQLLSDDAKGLRAMILTLIGLGVCLTEEELRNAMHSTLLSVQSDSSVDLEHHVSEALESLLQLGHVSKFRAVNHVNTDEGDEIGSRIQVTQLGYATFKGCIDTDNSPLIYRELSRAQENLVLANELHLLYLVTPLDLRESVEPDWRIYFTQVLSLSELEQRAAELIGISEGLLSMKATGRRVKKDKVTEGTVRRFYLSLILYKLLKEHTAWQVAELFNVTRGFVQSLLSSASSFASCMVYFTKELTEFSDLNLLLEAMVKKLSYTASLELVPLMEVPGVKQARARQLFKLGYKSLSSLAFADAKALVQQVEHLSRRQALQIVSAAKMLLEEKADALREEAEEMVLAPESAQ